MIILWPVRSCGNGTMALRGRRSPTSVDGLGGPSYKTSDFNRLRYSLVGDRHRVQLCFGVLLGLVVADRESVPPV